jgi:hypothetical protein
MKTILMIFLWTVLVLGGAFGLVVFGFWSFLNDHYILGALDVLLIFLFIATYAATNRFTEWPRAARGPWA